MSFVDRAFRAVNLEDFKHGATPDYVFDHELRCPHDEQYILRMMVKEPHGEFVIPSELEWTRDILNKCQDSQDKANIRHGFCYLTVRHGYHKATTDDEWHVDGFSQIISHIPEQNYIATSNDCTEYVSLPMEFPSDFDPMSHDIVQFINDQFKEQDPEIMVAKPNAFYVFDPYVVHRRPVDAYGKMRTFVRVSFLPIEIYDDKCTKNPLMKERVYNRIAKNTRSTLKKYIQA